MLISINESDSTRKSIDVTVTPSATGVSVSGSVRWFDVLYTIPSVTIPCVYVNDAAYRVALCSTPPRLVLVEDDATPVDEVCYLARWMFEKATDTCASVTIEVPKRVLVPMHDDDGQVIALPTPTSVAVSAVLASVLDAEETRGRKRRKRIKALIDDCKVLRDAGTTYGAMTAAEKAKVNELVALLTDVPLAVP